MSYDELNKLYVLSSMGCLPLPMEVPSSVFDLFLLFGQGEVYFPPWVGELILIVLLLRGLIGSVGSSISLSPGFPEVVTPAFISPWPLIQFSIHKD